jgi:hypothetical protein
MPSLVALVFSSRTMAAPQVVAPTLAQNAVPLPPHVVHTALPQIQPQNAPPPPYATTTFVDFELMLSVLQPPKRVRTATKKTKTEKQDALSIGPVNCNTAMGWDMFLATVSRMLDVQPGNLAINSFEWHFIKPASAPWLPVQNETGLVSLLRKIGSKSDQYVILRMQPPKPDHTAPVRPWTTAPATDSAIADEDDIEGEEQGATKKVR